MKRSLLLFSVLSLILFSCSNNTKDTIKSLSGTKLIKSFEDASLSYIDADDSEGPVYVLKLQGSHYEMGYQYGYLVGDKVNALWWRFMEGISDITDNERGLDVPVIPAEVLDTMFGTILEDAFEHLEPYLPKEIKDEIDGIGDGAKASGLSNLHPTVKQIVKRTLALANISDLDEWNRDLNEIIKVFATGYSYQWYNYYGIKQTVSTNYPPGYEEAFDVMKKTLPHMNCSFFSAWGDRTKDGHLLGSRNLDWSSNTGINRVKLLTVYKPDNGYSYLTIGYAGFIGALAGISSKGLIVGEVGSNNVLERLKGEPWVIKFREIMEKASNLNEATQFIINNVDDGFNRPNTIGYNCMVSWGDPEHNGADASGSIFELNGALAAVRHHSHDCKESVNIYKMDKSGKVTNYNNPVTGNLEGNTYEINIKGEVRKLIKTEDSYYDDVTGSPLKVGKPLACAFYKGDEALTYNIRRWQSASHGPWAGDGTGLMFESGSYNGRYLPMYNMIKAYESGTAYNDEDISIDDNGGVKTPLTLVEGEKIVSRAAMNGNIISVAYDATALKIRVSFESGSGENWVAASHSKYYELDLNDWFK